MALARITVFLLLIIFCEACSELPKDQRGTTNRILESRIIRVGLIENAPWVIRTSGEPAGAEVELLRRFASSMGAQPEWHWGGEENLLGALEAAELDVAIGGFSDESPWSTRIGFTRYYFREKFDVGVRRGTRLDDIDGVLIAVTDALTAGFVREKGGVPVKVNSLTEAPDAPLAAAEWQLLKLGVTPTQKDLHTAAHVIAVPPGENQLVKRLEEFLSTQSEQIPALLASQPEVAK